MPPLLQARPIPIQWHPGLPIYASEPFLKSVGDEYGWLGGFDDAGRLRCVLPYTIVHKTILKLVRFRVETIPWEADLAVDSEKSFLESAMAHFRSLGIAAVIPATTNSIFRTYPTGADAAPYGSYILDLKQSEETLWANLHGKHRNVIRNAINKGVEVSSGLQHLETVHQLIRETLQRSGLGFMTFSALRKFVATLESNTVVMVATHQGILQGCAVIPYSRYSAYYLYGGSAAQTITGATNLLQWRAIQMLRELAVERYDFVGVRINPEKGSKQEGLKAFKERFRAHGSRVHLEVSTESIQVPPLYNLAVRLQRHGDIVDQERHKLSATTPFPARQSPVQISASNPKSSKTLSRGA